MPTAVQEYVKEKYFEKPNGIYPVLNELVDRAIAYSKGDVKILYTFVSLVIKDLLEPIKDKDTRRFLVEEVMKILDGKNGTKP